MTRYAKDLLFLLQAVYQRNGNLFFRTTIQKATTMEQSKNSSPFDSVLLTFFLRRNACFMVPNNSDNIFSPKFLLGRATWFSQSQAKKSEFFFIVIRLDSSFLELWRVGSNTAFSWALKGKNAMRTNVPTWEVSFVKVLWCCSIVVPTNVPMTSFYTTKWTSHEYIEILHQSLWILSFMILPHHGGWEFVLFVLFFHFFY